MEGKYAEVNDIRMYYELHGEGVMPLVLIHGGGSMIGTSFGHLLPLLSVQGRVIAVELQGHGRTSDREGAESFQQDADDVAALLSYLGIGRADVLGFSNGGSTALQLAIRHPEVVNKIVVISGAYRRDGLPPGFFEGMAGATLDVMPAVLREAFLSLTPDDGKLSSMFEKDKQRMIDFKDWADDDLRAIKAPALIMSSVGDVILPEHTIRLSRLIAGSKLVIFPGGHGEMIGALESGSGVGYADVVAWLVDRFLGPGLELNARSIALRADKSFVHPSDAPLR